jgi:tetratricopeptide (TPR) repeat protein
MYRMGGVSSFSPQTDIYELGATLFRLVTGVVPPSASDVINEGLPEFPLNISSSTKTAIEKAMESRKKDRPESMLSFLSLLGAKAQNEDRDTTVLIEPILPKTSKSNPKNPSRKTAGLSKKKALEVDDEATVIIETVEKQYGSNAERKYLDAANEGDAEAQYKLSMCYEKGKEVKKNSEEALKWLQLAANGGHVTAQLKMGGCCYDGKGVKQDYAEAIKWFQKAAEQGNADALVRLARCYYNGVGVKRDLDQATSLAKKALLIKPNDAGAEQVLDFINQMKIALSAASRRTRKKEEAKEVPKKDKAKVKETPKQFGILSIYSSCNGKDDASFTISVEMGEEKQLMAFFSVSRNGEPVTVFGSSTQFGDNVIVKKPKDSTVGRGTVSFDFSQSQLQSEPSGTITFELNIILSKHMNSTKIMEDDLNYSYQYRIVHVSHLFKHDEWKSLRLIKQIV